MMSSIFNIIFVTCVARKSCCRLPASVSKTPCSRMSLVPTSLQSMPRYGLSSFNCKTAPTFRRSAGLILSNFCCAGYHVRMTFCCPRALQVEGVRWSGKAKLCSPHLT